MKNKLTKYVIRILAGILGILTIAMTLFLFLYIFWKGKNVMSLSFILDKPAGVPLGTAGGIYPALMGSIYLGALSALMGGIIGIGVAVYLVFYTRESIFYHVISACITGLSGIPSILFGLVGYTLLIYQFGLGRSLLCSAICVAVMIVPFIAIRAEKILKEKGTEYMKNSLALGMSREYAVTINSSGLCSGIAWNGGAWNGIRNGSGCTDFVYGCGYGRRCSGKTYGSIYVIAVSSVYAGK